MNLIPYGRQDIDQEDINAVIDVLKSDWLTQGPAIGIFEKEISRYCGAKHAVAISSATAALHIACLAAGLGPGDWLWTSPNTFVASANCGLYCGAKVDFVDIDPKSYNIKIDSLKSKLREAEAAGKLPKVLIPVHFAGQSCEMATIAELAKQYKFVVIEDASHAIGGKYRDLPIGSCTYSDMTIFSFHPVKIITTGEGGMILTNNKDLKDKLMRLRTHGITREESLMVGQSHGSWYYQQIDLGYNYRMTDIQAALGTSQLGRIEEFIRKRHQIARSYNDFLLDLPLVLPWQHADTFSSFHLYVIRLKLKEIKKTHRQVFEELRNKGINVNLHYIPVHLQPYYQQLGFREGDFPEAESYYKEAITLPIYPTLREDEFNKIILALKQILV